MKTFADEDFDEFKAPDLALWKLIRSAIEHENNLVNHRLTWLITSQGFSFALFGAVYLAIAKKEADAYGIQSLTVLCTISTVAVYMCVVIQRAVTAAIDQIQALQDFYDNRWASEKWGAKGGDNRTPPLQRWDLSDRKWMRLEFLPRGFLCAWIALVLGVVLDLGNFLGPLFERYGKEILMAGLFVIALISITVWTTLRVTQRKTDADSRGQPEQPNSIKPG